MACRFYNVTSEYEGKEPVSQLMGIGMIPATLSVAFAYGEVFGAGPGKFVIEPVELKEEDPRIAEAQSEGRRAEAQWKAEDAILAFKDCSDFKESLSTLIQEVLCGRREDDNLAAETCSAVARELSVLGTTLTVAGHYDEGEIKVTDLGCMLQSFAKRLEVASQLDSRLRDIREHEKGLQHARAMEQARRKGATNV